MIHSSEVKLYQPLLAGVYCLAITISKKVFWIIFNLPPIFIDPNYYTLLAIITFYYQFNMGHWFSHLACFPSFLLSDFFLFSEFFEHQTLTQNSWDLKVIEQTQKNL